MSFIHNKGLHNIIWAVLGKFFSGVKLALLGIIIARYLGPEDFGVLSYVVSFVTLLSVLAEFRLHNILVREVSEGKTNHNTLLGSSLSLCLFFSLVGYILLVFIIISIKEQIEVKNFILIYGLSYFFQSFRFLRAYFVANQKNNIIIRIELVTTVFIILTALFIVSIKGNIIHFILLRTMDFFMFSLVIVALYNGKNNKIKQWKVNKEIRQKLFKDSLPLVLSGFALIVFQRIDQIMIRNFISDYAVGQYSAAVSITSIVAFVPIIISESIVPAYIKVKNFSSDDYYIWFRQRFSDFLTWGGFFLSFIIMILSPFIIKVLYGNDYLPAIEVMKVFSWKGMLIALGAAAGQIMIIENKHQISYWKSIFGGLANIGLNFFLILKYGMIGAVWASLLAFLISSYLSHLVLKRYNYIFWIQTKSLAFGLFNLVKDGKRFFKEATIKV